MRRRRIIAGGLVVAVLAAAALALGTLGSEAMLADRAARLVPANALLYAHLSTDPARAADGRLVALVGQFPSLRAMRDRLLAIVSGTPGGFDVRRDVRPWLGREVAFALLDTNSAQANSLILLSVRDRGGAKRFLARVAGAQGVAPYRGVPVQKFGLVAAAFAGDFLALGQVDSVHAAIDHAQRTGVLPLDRTQGFVRATRGRPADRSFDVYLPPDGIRRVLAPLAGLPGALASTLDAPDLLGVSLSLSARTPGLALRVRTVRARTRASEFAPSLLGTVPREAAGYAGLAGLDALGRVLGNAVGAGVRSRLGSVLADSGVDVRRDVLGPLHGEVAFSVTPSLPVPVVTLVARTADARRTREALARLQQPLAALLARPAQAGAPQSQFQSRELGGVTAFALPVSAGVELTYAVTGGRLIVSTQANGVGRVLAKRESLAGDPRFTRVVPELPGQAESILFLDLSQLLALAEQAGLAGGKTLSAVREDLRRIRATGAVIRREKTDSTAEFLFDIP